MEKCYFRNCVCCDVIDTMPPNLIQDSNWSPSDLLWFCIKMCVAWYLCFCCPHTFVLKPNSESLYIICFNRLRMECMAIIAAPLACAKFRGKASELQLFWMHGKNCGRAPACFWFVKVYLKIYMKKKPCPSLTVSFIIKQFRPVNNKSLVVLLLPTS